MHEEKNGLHIKNLAMEKNIILKFAKYSLFFGQITQVINVYLLCYIEVHYWTKAMLHLHLILQSERTKKLNLPNCLLCTIEATCTTHHIVN